MSEEIDDLLEGSQVLKKIFPHHCGNGFVSSQYHVPLKIISKYFSKEEFMNKKILDWGCGIGHFSYMLMKKGFEVHGYSYTIADDCSKMQKILKKQFNKDWHLKSASDQDPVKLPYSDNSFDAVISLGVLEHVKETKGNELSSLKEIHRILKPQGTLFIFHLPNRYSWIEFVTRLGVKMKFMNKYYHSFLYDKDMIYKFAKESNYDILDAGLYNLLPRMFFHRFNSKLLSSKKFVGLFETFEKICSIFFKKLSQNYFFVFRKK